MVLKGQWWKILMIGYEVLGKIWQKYRAQVNFNMKLRHHSSPTFVVVATIVRRTVSLRGAIWIGWRTLSLSLTLRMHVSPLIMSSRGRRRMRRIACGALGSRWSLWCLDRRGLWDFPAIITLMSRPRTTLARRLRRSRGWGYWLLGQGRRRTSTRRPIWRWRMLPTRTRRRSPRILLHHKRRIGR